jgi:hypothetical protein
MIRPVRSALAAAALAAGVTASVAAPASASQPTTLGSIKTRAAAAISLRLSALGDAVNAVNGNRWLTASNKATVLTILNGDVSGLTALGPKIQADTTVTQARSDYRSIFLDYRVFALALPQTRFAAAADDLLNGVVPRLTDAQHRLASLLSGADSGRNGASVQAAMSDLAKQITAISTSVTGMPTQILAFTPAEYDANHSLLLPIRATLTSARSDALAARSDVLTVLEAIR